MSDVKHITLEAASAAVASKTPYAGATVSVFGWLASNEAGVVIGVLIGLVGLAANIWFKLREDRRQQREHETRMRAINGDYL